MDVGNTHVMGTLVHKYHTPYHLSIKVFITQLVAEVVKAIPIYVSPQDLYAYVIK